MTVADPVTAHVAELERVLCGPGRVRRSMIREVRDGLHDAVAAYRDGGLDHERAATRAVRDFGPIREIAPHFQEELAARQGRWTALLIMVTFPGMVLGWDLVWRSSAGSQVEPPFLTVVLARVQDASAMLIGAAAVALLALSFHRTAAPRLVTSLVGVVACVGAVVCCGTAVVMNLSNAPSAAAMIATNAYTLPAFVVSGLVFTFVMWSAVRTIRVARAI